MAEASASVSLAETKPKEWRKLPPLSERRVGAAGVWVNDHQFLVVGGQSRSSCEYYDKLTNRWSMFPFDLPESLDHFQATLVGERLFVLGGWANSWASSDLRSINISGNDLSKVSGGWKEHKSMNQPRADFACVSDAEFIYVFGGGEGYHDQFCEVERYNTKTNEWTSLPEMPEKRRCCSAGMVGNKIYVVGGTTSDEKTDHTTTSVFDTVKSEWEPASTVPDMKSPLDSVKVVVVDHFVIAIGSDEKSRPSIEVLDTQRNAWAKAPSFPTMKLDQYVTGVLKETKEIIVATGENVSDAEMIRFEDGIWPDSFRFKERGQTVLGDTERGEDTLDVEIIADALVESLMFLDLAPPFVMAILGKWGRGKSFFFNLMLDHMIRIQRTPVDDYFRSTYAGHIYIVKFNAWTFSKGCIFSSFMYEILKTLNEVLQFEHQLDKNLLKDGKVSTIEVFRDLSKRQIEYAASTEKVWEDYGKLVMDAKKKNEFASETLLMAINSSYKEDKKDLKKYKMEIHKERTKRQAEAAVGDIKRILNGFGKSALDWGLEKAFENLDRIPPEYEKQDEVDEKDKQDEGDKKDIQEIEEGDEKDEQDEGDKKDNQEIEEGDEKDEQDKGNKKGKQEIEEGDKHAIFLHFNSIFDPCLQMIETDDIQNFEDCNKLIEAIKNMKIRWYHTFWVSNVSSTTIIFSSAIAVVAVFLLHRFQEDIIGMISGLISGCLAFVIPVLTSVSAAMEKINPIVKEFDNISRRLEEDPELGNSDDETIKELERKKSEIENRILGLEGCSLMDIAKSIDKADYEKNLGIVHKVQQDLMRLSDGMLNLKQKRIFPRGSPRIVLFVDDLDRCEKDKVVEVIEALQLLVKTKLFVAVLAIDPRYVTTSIESKYEGILDSRVPPSGMDFLEKIIQIPFRLPGVDQDSIDKFVDSQIQIEETKAVDTPSDKSNVINNKTAESISGPTKPEESQRKDKDTTPENSDDREALPRDKVFFTEDEAKMMKEVVTIFGLGPRCIRRIINVYKVLQVVWKRGSSKFPVDPNLKRATLFLMLMASDESTRDVTYKIFDWMDCGRVKYHNVALDDDVQNDLASVFTKELKEWDKSFELSYTCSEGGSEKAKSTKEGTLIDYIQKYLAEYTWKDFEGWSKVSKKFMLARCFSFYRVTSEEEDEKEKNQS